MRRPKVSTVFHWLQGAVGRVRDFAYADTAEKPKDRPRIGLALGGGFARGIAHIGVLRVLEQNGIPIDCISGTSVGALIAAAYASGVPLEVMERKAIVTQFKDFARWTVSWMGLATNERLENYLGYFTETKRFEELRIPLAIAATDLNSGAAVYFTSGLIGPALRASCAYPGLFLPVEHQGMTLVDGFVAAPVPVSAARQLGADIVIAVYLESSSDQKPRSVADVIGRSFAIIQGHANIRWLQEADVLIEPDVKKIVWDDFRRSPELIAAGEEAARAALPRIRAVLEHTSRQTVATRQ
jgi:NTE family protein